MRYVRLPSISIIKTLLLILASEKNLLRQVFWGQIWRSDKQKWTNLFGQMHGPNVRGSFCCHESLNRNGSKFSRFKWRWIRAWQFELILFWHVFDITRSFSQCSPDWLPSFLKSLVLTASLAHEAQHLVIATSECHEGQMSRRCSCRIMEQEGGGQDHPQSVLLWGFDDHRSHWKVDL